MLLHFPQKYFGKAAKTKRTTARNGSKGEIQTDLLKNPSVLTPGISKFR